MAKPEEAKSFTRVILLEKIEQEELAIRNHQRLLEDARNALAWIDGDQSNPKQEQAIPAKEHERKRVPAPEACVPQEVVEELDSPNDSSGEGELPGPRQHELITLIDALKAKNRDVKSIWVFTWKELPLFCPGEMGAGKRLT